jgi:hypothetical protein
MIRHLAAGFAVLVASGAILLSAAPNPFDQSTAPLEVDSPDAKMAKIVILAGAPSSKSGAHEYFAGCALLTQWLRQQPGVWPVMAREWPKDEKVFENARCVVYFGDGGIKNPCIEPARWAKLSRLMDGGAGFVLLHQAVDFPKGPDAEKVQGWLGGVFHGDIGCRGHWDMDLKPVGEHPVLRGVKPFAAPGDGWLYNLHFLPQAKPLLVGAVPDKSRTTADAKKHPGRDEVIAWAAERPGGAGGRGFGFTGADLHKSWGYESQRRLVVNGILWAAKLEVPAAGAKMEFSEVDLARNLDKKTPPPTKAASKTAAPPAK